MHNFLPGDAAPSEATRGTVLQMAGTLVRAVGAWVQGSAAAQSPVVQQGAAAAQSPVVQQAGVASSGAGHGAGTAGGPVAQVGRAPAPAAPVRVRSCKVLVPPCLGAGASERGAEWAMCVQGVPSEALGVAGRLHCPPPKWPVSWRPRANSGSPARVVCPCANMFTKSAQWSCSCCIGCTG